MTPESLARALADFLADARGAVVIEDGEEVFDFSTARYSVSADRGRCLLHLWSEERNTVRRVLDAEASRGALRLSVQRFGQSRPARMEILCDRDRRPPAARRAARSAYRQRLRRILERNFPDLRATALTSAMDLERSFGPVYTRGLLRRGRSAFAVLGVNAAESQPAVDGALTFGLLWLDHLRRREAGRLVIEGLKLFVPAGRCAIVRERMAHLDRSAARFQLFEVNERAASLDELDTADRGNIATRLVRSVDEAAARARFAGSVARILALVPEAEVTVLSPAEIAFRLHGLEFARARSAPGEGFRSELQIVFGIAPEETVLTAANEARFVALAQAIAATRSPAGPRDHPLWRMQPERWLESLVAQNVAALDTRLDPACVYSQVPAFAAGDRAMIDVLAATREGRLAVIELKAGEDIHLPLQGLDYWARVVWHHQRGEFRQFGYFAGRELSLEPPHLLLVAPALHVHPATDTLLRYLAPEIDCTLLGVDERWRDGVRVIFRKRKTAATDLRR